MTFQIGVVVSDGIILASDTKINEIDKADENAATSGHSPKIILSEDPPVMYCWAGDETPGSIGRAFVHLSKNHPSSLPRRMDDLLFQAATRVWTESYGPKYADPPVRVCIKHKEGNLLIAAEGKSGIELWRLDYGVDFPCRQISDKSSCGYNCAVFLLEKYYRSALKMKEILPIIAHCIIMGGKINPTGVGGLEIATWGKEENEPTRLPPTEIDSVIQTSTELDERIGKLLVPGRRRGVWWRKWSPTSGSCSPESDSS